MGEVNTMAKRVRQGTIVADVAAGCPFQVQVLVLKAQKYA
jgi:hypothetical protein